MMAKKNLSPIDQKFREDKLKLSLVTNNDLVCRDCTNRWDDAGLPCNTSKCEKYQDIKPNEVLDGGECDEYTKE